MFTDYAKDVGPQPTANPGQLLGDGIKWQDAANEIKRSAPSNRKRKFVGLFEMRGKKPGV